MHDVYTTQDSVYLAHENNKSELKEADSRMIARM